MDMTASNDNNNKHVRRASDYREQLASERAWAKGKQRRERQSAKRMTSNTDSGMKLVDEWVQPVEAELPKALAVVERNQDVKHDAWKTKHVTQDQCRGVHGGNTLGQRGRHRQLAVVPQGDRRVLGVSHDAQEDLLVLLCWGERLHDPSPKGQERNRHRRDLLHVVFPDVDEVRTLRVEVIKTARGSRSRLDQPAQTQNPLPNPACRLDEVRHR